MNGDTPRALKIQVAKKSRGWVTAGKLNNDVYLRRLMADELFLGSLKNLFFNDQIVMAVQERVEDFDSLGNWGPTHRGETRHDGVAEVLVVRMTFPHLFICSNLQIATCGAVK